MPRSLDDALAAATLPRKTVRLLLDRTRVADHAALVQRVADADAQIDVDAGRETKNLTQAFHRQARKDRDALAALEASMLEDATELAVQGLPFEQYNRLVIANPPRKGDQVGETLGFDAATFYPALVKASLVDVTDAQWDRLRALMVDSVLDQLVTAAIDVNRRVGADVPFSPPASQPTGG